jgi:hypothetical protein
MELPAYDTWLHVDPEYPEVYFFGLEVLDRPA